MIERVKNGLWIYFFILVKYFSMNDFTWLSGPFEIASDQMKILLENK